MNWISVKERYPALSCDCLVTNGEAIWLAFYQRPVWKYGHRFMIDDDGVSRAMNGVTHWCPIPELPKEE